MKHSPLFWPIELKGSTIYILDETRLPEKLAYLKAKNYRQAIRAIKEMKTRAVGQVLLVMYVFLQAIKQQRGKKDIIGFLEKIAAEINAARPTLPFKVLTDMVLEWAMASDVSLGKNISGFLEGLKAKRIEQARKAAQMIDDGDTVLTHCNISGLMPIIGQFALDQGKKIRFFVTETRPYLQGSRLTAWELKQAGFDVTVICDNMVAQVMHEGKIKKVIVGADHLARNGDIANKIGTFQIALLARHFHVPFYVICPPASKAESGRDITIEVRSDKEILEYKGMAFAPAGVKAYYPAFDITPRDLITMHIYLGI